MTINYLPESDRIAADFNPVLDAVAAAKPETADAFETGALSVIGLMAESFKDLRDKSNAQAEAMGFPVILANDAFNDVFDSFDAIMQPRLDALRDAVKVAQGLDKTPQEMLADLFDALMGEPSRDLASFFDYEDEDEDDYDFDFYEDEDEDDEPDAGVTAKVA